MNAVIRLLTYLLIIVFPLGMLVRISLAQNVSIIPQDIVMGVLAVALWSLFLFNKRQSEFGKFLFLQVLFLIVGIIVLAVNVLLYRDINVVVALLYSLRYFAYLSLLLVGPYFAKSRYVGRAIVFSGFVFLVAGFVQFVKFYDLGPLFHLGWDDHLYRLFSTVLDPNYAGVMYVLFFLLLSRYVYIRTFYQGYKELLLSFFTALAIYLTYSRTALVALVSGLFMVGIAYKKMKFLIGVVVVVVVMLSIVSDTSVEGLNPFRTNSTMGRISSIREAFTVIEKSSALGVGFNAYRYAQVRYDIREEIGAARSHSDAGTDNSLLFVIATTGVMGALFFVGSYVVMLRMLLIEKSIFFAAMLVSLFAASFFLNVLFYTPILAFFFLVVSLRRHFS